MRYRNGRYARQISRNINSGIYLGPTQGLSSPKNNRRACLCTDKNTYSRDCCNGNLIAQGIGVIQAPANVIPTSTTTTTSGPTTTTTSGPTTTSTSTTSTSTSTSTTAAPTTTSTSTSTSTTSTSTSTTSTSTSTSTSTTTAAPTTTSTSTSTTSTSTSTSTTAAPSPVVTGSLVSWQNYLTFNPTSSTWINSGPTEPGNYAIIQGTQPALSGSLGVEFNGTNNYLTYNAFGASPNDLYTLQMYGTFPAAAFPGANYDLWTNDDFTNGWDTIISSTGNVIYRDTNTKQIDLAAQYPPSTALRLLTLVCNQTDNSVKVYINTTEVGNMSSGSVAQWFQQDAMPQFGWNTNSDAGYFRGTVKQLLVYSTALSQADITYNYNGLSSL